MTQSTIYEIMYSCCCGELLAFVTQAITTRQKFENFHASLLGQFILSRQMSQLRAEKYERVQFEGEPFATYVQSIRDSALVLRIKENEKQVMERVVEGIMPVQQARFVFQAPLTYFLQLEKLAIVDRNIAYADQSRAAQPAEVTIGATELLPEPENPRYSHARTSQSLMSGKSFVCYYCQKPGHTQKMCFLQLSQLHKPVRPVAKSLPQLGIRCRKIAGVVTTLAPSIRTQVGKLCLTALLDSGSIRSLISLELFQQMRRADPNISLMGTDCTCVTASGQGLEIVGQVKVPLKIQGFLWSWGFLVSKILRSQPILGADFIAKTKIVLELGSSRCYFAFAPSVYEVQSKIKT